MKYTPAYKGATGDLAVANGTATARVLTVQKPMFGMGARVNLWNTTQGGSINVTVERDCELSENKEVKITVDGGRIVGIISPICANCMVAANCRIGRS